MAISIGNGWYRCPYCNFKARSVIDVDDHRDQEHTDILLVPLTKSDIVRLVQFIMTKDDKLITESLYLILKQYSTFTPKNTTKLDKMV